MKRLCPHTLLALAIAVAFQAVGIVNTSAANAPDTSHAFMWDRANARLAVAQTPGDFADAAARYEDLIRAGVCNGPLFSNYGLALLEARRPADAMRALLRAERYAGTSPAIRQNIRRAEATATEGPPLAAPWLRTFLFWHYGLGLSMRTWLATAGFFLICTALAARVWGRGPAAQSLQALGLVTLMMFGTSTAASWHAELRDRADFSLRLARTQATALEPAKAGGGHAPATAP